MPLLDHFNPHSVAVEQKRFPDSVLAGDGTDWPVLRGVVGVFFSSRSGSTALARMAERHFHLERVGESLNAAALHMRAEKQGLADLQTTLKGLVGETSTGGWFMFKAGVPGLVNAARIGFADQYRARIHPVLLLRRDGLGQALSILAANRTRKYHSTQAAKRELRAEDYDYDFLTQQLRVITRANAAIGKALGWFPNPAQVLLYEDFQHGDEAAVIAALAATGLPARAVPVENPHRVVERITHPLTQDFRARFLAECHGEAADLLATHAEFVEGWTRRA